MGERILKIVAVVLGALTVAGVLSIALRRPPGVAAAAAAECRANLRLIDQYKCLAAIRHNLTNAVDVTRQQLSEFLIMDFPECPDGGAYRINPIGSLPECSRGGAHSLPADYGKPAAAPTLVPEEIGVRRIALGDKTHNIRWYRIRADDNAIRSGSFWPRIGCPTGTVAAYVGRYQRNEWCEWHADGNTRDQMSAWGVSFVMPAACRVAPGPGPVNIRWWLFEEKGDGVDLAFRDGRYYVFCLDRQPVATWTHAANRASCDLDTELEHVIGVIEIQPPTPSPTTGPGSGG